MKQGISFIRLVSSQASARVLLFKLADHSIGPLVPAPQSRPVPLPDRVRRILLIRPGGIGDAVLAIPLVRLLLAGFPGASLDIIAEKRNASVFGLVREEFSDCMIYDTPGFLGECRLRSGSYDLVVDTEQWHYFSAILASRFSGGTTAGFDTRAGRSRFYSLRAEYSHRRYEGESFLDLLRCVLPGCRIDFPGGGFLSLPEDAIERAREETGSRFAALYLSSSIPQRSWPASHWRMLIEFLRDAGLNPVLVGGKTESSLAAGLMRRFGPGQVIDRTGTPLSRTASLVAASRVFIGADSGILHLAYALGCPTVSFFGPGIEEKWAPRGSRHLVLNKKLSCSPCTLFGYTPRCRRASCMSEISPEETMQAVRTRIG